MLDRLLNGPLLPYAPQPPTPPSWAMMEEDLTAASPSDLVFWNSLTTDGGKACSRSSDGVDGRTNAGGHVTPPGPDGVLRAARRLHRENDELQTSMSSLEQQSAALAASSSSLRELLEGVRERARGALSRRH